LSETPGFPGFWRKYHAETTEPTGKYGLNQSGWLYVLPYLDQGPLYSQFNLSQATGSAMGQYCCPGSYFMGTQAVAPALVGNPATNGNGLLAETQLAVFRCPSDPGSPILAASEGLDYAPDATHYGVKTNYDFCVSNEYRCNAWSLLEGPSTRRMFGENSNAKVAHVTDGTSNTIMLGETLTTIYNGRTLAWSYRGWVQVGVNPGDGINVWHTPTPPPVLPPVIGELASWPDAGSQHAGGCFFAFADGSVRFLDQSLDTTTLTRLSAMADGAQTPNYAPDQ
jgi:hypothetical protein